MEAPAVPLGTAELAETRGLRAKRGVFRIPDDIWEYLGLGIDPAGNMTISPARRGLLLEIFNADRIGTDPGHPYIVIGGARFGVPDGDDYDLYFDFRQGSPHTRENARIIFHEDDVTNVQSLNIVLNLLRRLRQESKGRSAAVAVRGLRQKLPAVAQNKVGEFVAGPPVPRPPAPRAPAAAGAPQGGRKTRRKSKKTLRKSKW